MPAHDCSELPLPRHARRTDTWLGGAVEAMTTAAATETGDEAGGWIASAIVSATTERPLNLLVAGSLGLGFICFLRRAQPPKPLSAAITAAHGALKSARALGDLQFPPSPDALLLASKALLKGYKASKRLNLIRRAPGSSSSSLSKRLAAYLRALSVVRHARRLLRGDEVAGLGCLSSGYKFSKNCLKLLEGFTGKGVDSALRDGFDAAGLLIKAAIVVAELERIAVEARRGNNCRCGIAGKPCPRYAALRWKLEMSAIGRGFEAPSRFPVEHSAPCQKVQKVLNFEQTWMGSPSELLCLSIPLTTPSTSPSIL